VRPEPKIIPLKGRRDRLLVLNQLDLPHETNWFEARNEVDVARSIKDMYVRGAPAIGIAAAFGFYLGVWSLVGEGKKITIPRLRKIKRILDKSRPTAINLFWATNEMLQYALELFQNLGLATSSTHVMDFLLRLYEKAVAIHEDDADRCYQMGLLTKAFIEKKVKKTKYNALTHCNTGALATGGIGTALGVIRLLGLAGKISTVYVDETRPYLQGSRLTAHELKKEKIPATLVVDSMAAYLMQKKLVDFIVVGADRIARNGDVANKIGTYSLAVAARAHNVPFIVVAPKSSFDLKLKSGKEIPVEERSQAEVSHVGNTAIAAQVPVLNYSFDLTPYEYITAIVSEEGVYRPTRR